MKKTKNHHQNTLLVQMQESGGNVIKDIVGEQLSTAEQEEALDAPIVAIRKY